MNAVITYIFGKNKELLRTPLVIDPDVEYICVTDQPDLKSNVWKIVYDNIDQANCIRDKMVYVKYNSFKYTNADKILVMDGSFEIKNSINELFNDDNFDIGLKLHPIRDNLKEELPVWKKCRNLPDIVISKFNSMAKIDKIELNEVRIYETSTILFKNTKLNKDICSLVLNYMKLLGDDGKLVLTNQCVLSYIIHSYFKQLNIKIINRNDYFNRYYHNTHRLVIEAR